MKNNFKIAVDFVLAHEGGYSNNPKDPGGETHWGISKRSWPLLDIKALTKKQAKEIYRSSYWDSIFLDEEPFPKDIIIFDTAVNIGVGNASELFLKSTCWRDAILRRIEYYTKLKNFKYFGRGWVNRCIDLAHLIEKESKKGEPISLLIGGEKEEE